MNSEIKAVIIDHDDSFSHNLRHWLRAFIDNVAIINHRELNSKFKNQDLENYNLIVLSPGPKNPADYPHVKSWLQNRSPKTAVLGVCLGMQLMVETEGGTVETYQPPLHGKTSTLKSYITEFNGLRVGRYHSLLCKPTNKFNIKATADSDIPMWIEHTEKKWLGFQFHPESFLTEKTDVLQKYVKEWLKQ